MESYGTRHNAAMLSLRTWRPSEIFPNGRKTDEKGIIEVICIAFKSLLNKVFETVVKRFLAIHFRAEMLSVIGRACKPSWAIFVRNQKSIPQQRGYFFFFKLPVAEIQSGYCSIKNK